MVHPEVRKTVEESSVPATQELRNVEKNGENNGDSDVAHGNQRSLTAGEHICVRVEVKLLRGGRFRAVAPDQALDTGTSVDKNVRGPANKLVEKKGSESDNGRVSGGVVDELGNNAGLGLDLLLVLVLAGGDENGVALHVVVEAVVTSVGELPAEEGHQKGAVEEPAGDGVDGEVGGERVVAALVRQDPDTGEEQSLDETVDGPERDLHAQRGVHLGEKGGGVEERANDDEIPDNVGERVQH